MKKILFVAAVLMFTGCDVIKQVETNGNVNYITKTDSALRIGFTVQFKGDLTLKGDSLVNGLPVYFNKSSMQVVKLGNNTYNLVGNLEIKTK